MNKTTLYNGDCTRTVVNGEIAPIYQKTSEAVRAAKAAATATIKADVDGETVHKATIKALEEHGFGYAAPEPPRRKTRFVAPAARRAGSGSRPASLLLTDFRGPKLVVGDVVSVEPGLYGKGVGGIRIEDIVAVTEDGRVNLGSPSPEQLDWLE